MWTYFWIAVVAVGGYFAWKHFRKTPAGAATEAKVEDAAKTAVEGVKAEVTESILSVADVNKDGKVDLNDAKAAAKKVTAKAKKNVAKGVAKTAAKVEKAATKKASKKSKA